MTHIEETKRSSRAVIAGAAVGIPTSTCPKETCYKSIIELLYVKKRPTICQNETLFTSKRDPRQDNLEPLCQKETHCMSKRDLIYIKKRPRTRQSGAALPGAAVYVRRKGGANEIASNDA